MGHEQFAANDRLGNVERFQPGLHHRLADRHIGDKRGLSRRGNELAIVVAFRQDQLPIAPRKVKNPQRPLLHRQ